ncbi:hypothetical protein DFP73DRAFT_589142 [Morchella snyderi]|nr:hypothetical protein DFP73DRAFT_589142 [Morchella snyderi]
MVCYQPHILLQGIPRFKVMNSDEYSLRSREESSGSSGGLDNGDIITIVGIFTSVITTVFGVWLLDKLRKRFRGSAAHEGSTEELEANVNHGSSPSSHEPRSASILLRQDLESSTALPAQMPRVIMVATSAPEASGLPLRPPADSVHQLEIGINRPKRAYTWAPDKTKH